MKLKLWTIWQILRGEITGMKTAPGKPLTIEIENNYNLTIHTKAIKEDVRADFNLLASMGKRKSE